MIPCAWTKVVAEARRTRTNSKRESRCISEGSNIKESGSTLVGFEAISLHNTIRTVGWDESCACLDDVGFENAQYNSRRRLFVVATIIVTIVMMIPPAANVRGTPSRCETVPATILPIGIVPMNDNINMLITLPRI